MKLQILAAARNDLIEGFRFYDSREPGLGDYFFSVLYSDLESLRVFTANHMEIGIARCPSGSHLRFTTALRVTLYRFEQFWTVDEIRHGFASALNSRMSEATISPVSLSHSVPLLKACSVAQLFSHQILPG